MMAFAWSNSARTDPSLAAPDGVRDFFAQNPGDYRVLMQIMPTGYDGGFLLGVPDLWGNDPFVLRRYAEFMAFTRGKDPNQASQTLSPFEGGKFYDMTNGMLGLPLPAADIPPGGDG